MTFDWLAKLRGSSTLSRPRRRSHGRHTAPKVVEVCEPRTLLSGSPGYESYADSYGPAAYGHGEYSDAYASAYEEQTGEPYGSYGGSPSSAASEDHALVEADGTVHIAVLDNDSWYAGAPVLTSIGLPDIGTTATTVDVPDGLFAAYVDAQLGGASR